MTSRSPRRLRGNPLEWAVLLVSLGMLAGVLGVLGREAWRNGGNSEPQIEAAIGRLQASDAGLRAEIIVRNRGTGVAEDVTLSVALSPPEGEAHTAEIQFPHLPSGAEARGFVQVLGRWAGSSVTKDHLQLRVVGYRTR